MNVHQTVLEAKKSVGDLTEEDLKGKRVFVRADFNVPLEKGKITDDTRIRGAIPTIKYLTSKGAKVLLSSHLGRPKGGYEAKFSLGMHLFDLHQFKIMMISAICSTNYPSLVRVIGPASFISARLHRCFCWRCSQYHERW